MIAVFNHFLSLHGFFLSISFSHSYHLTPSSRCLASFLCFSASVSSCVSRSWRARCMWMKQKLNKDLKKHDIPNYEQGGVCRFQASFYSKNEKASSWWPALWPPKSSRINCMATQQWYKSAFMLHIGHKKAIVDMKTANSPQSQADDFLLCVCFE